MSQTKSESSACRCFFIWTHWKDAMHYYPHHIGDFTRDTARLSDAQCMAYLRMIWAYYDTEKPLPDDPESIAFQLGTSPDLVRQILQHYFVFVDGAWSHARCDAVILGYRSKSGKARESANARWKNAGAMRTHSERSANGSKNDANQEPITNNQEPVIKETPRKRSAPPAVAKPDDVEQQTWDDWLALRKAKKAPVTETVVNGARAESIKAGMGLDAFFRVWCTRGSQGLQADWLRPDERPQRGNLSFAQADEQIKRRNWEEMTGRKWPNSATVPEFIDAEEVNPKRIAA